jgi:hypothetical protein
VTGGVSVCCGVGATVGRSMWGIRFSTGEILTRAECVRCPWALLRNEVSTINGVFFSIFSLSPDTFLPEGVIVGFRNPACGFNSQKK